MLSAGMYDGFGTKKMSLPLAARDLVDEHESADDLAGAIKLKQKEIHEFGPNPEQLPLLRGGENLGERGAASVG